MLTEARIKQYQERGYTILENALSQEELSILHEEADILSNHLMSEGYDLIKDFGCVIEPWNCGYLEGEGLEETNKYKTDINEYSRIRNSIYWNHPPNQSRTAAELILHKFGYIWASQLLQQKQVFLLNEQFIIKPPCTTQLSQFAWHKDSDYYTNTRLKNEPTIACWTALDDVNENNGTVQLIDFLGENKILKASAGTVLFMSNQLLHKSTGNSSHLFRRAFMAQFSTCPLLDDLQQCVGLAIPCIGIN